MKILLFIFVYFFIGFVICLVDSVRTCQNYNSDELCVMCLLWIILLPGYLVYLFCKKLTSIHNAMATKICEWIKAKNERRLNQG